ncbi:sulfate reduction electron transfer complex DsrMKJOP subunit DsrM [Desulfovibrio inopinatus]|uniref:sulfate reduction electron transfer complex DsrMKJOP subunit DsrM n=1 Tax=Desulfovibrio inopinatus TaxID=102109 RepID=UPI000423E6F0|nr:sulfate reduction electron transfer complex DsrMKJOP subunit DsrM [Desulfovibrio inopinatus]
MAAFFSLVAVAALMLIAYVGAGAGMQGFFGIFLPYVAIAVFIVGFVIKIYNWASAPVPFRIPTTAGQQKSLPWIKRNRFDNPTSGFETFVRMILEVVTFRSLFRNTSIQLDKEQGRVGFNSAKWLWLFALTFHYCFLLVLIRHLRFFLQPLPAGIANLDFMDSILQIGAPQLYITDIGILVGLGFLLLRRFFDSKVRYISLPSDYFPLFLILGIALTGMWMRYITKVDVINIKDLAYGLVTLSPVLPSNISATFFVHLFLVCVLFMYFPFSKLMHMGGVFLSPTRNLPNDSRIRRHINPWNDPEVKPHSYAAYEDDYREKMIEAGLPVEKEA